MEKDNNKNNAQALIKGAAATRIGGRKENQDNYGYKELPYAFIGTVCDGMGGGPGGRTASTIAVQAILASLEQIPANASDQEICQGLADAVSNANSAIREQTNVQPELRGMGSTCTIVYITARAAYVTHVGDSRVYQLRGRSKVFRTFDHSMVFDMVKQKLITEEQARLSAESNIITRALGTKPEVEATISIVPYLKGDRFVLCTDGIHGTLPEKDLLKMMGRRDQALAAVADDIAVRIDADGHNNGGGHDNLTIMLIDTLHNSKLKSKMSKLSKIIIIVLAVIAAVSIIFNILQACGTFDKDTVLTETTVQEVPVETESADIAKEPAADASAATPAEKTSEKAPEQPKNN